MDKKHARNLSISLFSGYRPTYQCAPVENLTLLSAQFPGDADIFVTYDKCSVSIYQNNTNGSVLLEERDCPNGYSYSTPKDATFVTEVDQFTGEYFLTCSKMTWLVWFCCSLTLSVTIQRWQSSRRRWRWSDKVWAPCWRLPWRTDSVGRQSTWSLTSLSIWLALVWPSLQITPCWSF